MTVKTVAVEADGPVALVLLDRPGMGNAINPALAAELREACRRVAQDDAVWVVVLAGRGDAFCRGTDASAFSEGGPTEEDLVALRVAHAVAALDKPVVAALEGDVLDQGLEIALACDLRVATRGARFALTHLARGMVPWDGGTQRLPRLVGRGRALEILLTSRPVEPEEALEAGLVHVVVDRGAALGRARELARTIAGHGPVASRYLKEAVSKGLDMTLAQGLRLEADLSFLLHTTEDRAEGIRSFRERGKPRYTGR